MTTPVQHLVLFRLPGTPGPEVEVEMRRHMATWVGTIAGLRRLRFGADVGGRAEGYQYGLLTEFDDAQALAAYLPHPLHQAFLEWVRARPFEVLRFDYPLTAETALLEPDSR
ncbi:MAG TPA: Dabb family protein [Candidatus Dormibacteraeota bacterium]|nr:Dabb family protein [Candidatus Dormibacteraeota bacterium]